MTLPTVVFINLGNPLASIIGLVFRRESDSHIFVVIKNISFFLWTMGCCPALARRETRFMPFAPAAQPCFTHLRFEIIRILLMRNSGRAGFVTLAILTSHIIIKNIIHLFSLSRKIRH